MRILAIERELKRLEPDTSAELLRQEARGVWALKKQEVIRDIWFTRRGRLAVVMLECAGAGEAEAHLAALPLVREGFIAFDLHPLVAYDGFERLFRPGESGSG